MSDRRGAWADSAVAPYAGAVSSGRRSIELPLALALLALGSIPDGMVYPALRALTVERYGITIDRASWFTLVPTLGAIASAFFLPQLVRRSNPLTVLRIASFVEAILLLLIALNVPFAMVIGLRLIGGACDLAGIAASLRIAARVAGEGHRARAMGWMGTAIMLGLLGGIGIGSIVPADWILVVAAGVLLLLTVATWPVERLVPRVHDPDPPQLASANEPSVRRERLIAALLVGTDRALSAVLSLVVPLAVPMLVAGGERSHRVLIGTILGLSMLGMVIGGPIGGEFVDRLGARWVRVVGSLIFGFGVLGLVFAAPLGEAAMIAAAALAGIGAAPLFASALAIGTRSGGSTGVYGAIQAAGQLGYAIGSGALILAAPFALGPEETLAAAAIVYVAVNLAATWPLMRIASRTPVAERSE
jgi:MFS family permease